MKVTYGAIVQRASGRFGGTVHSNWKGIDVVRRFAAPSNPNSTGQQEVRMAFKNLTKSFQMFTSGLVSCWAAYATGKKFLARNKYVGIGVPQIYGTNDLQDLSIYPGDSGAVPPTVTSVTGGAGTLTVVGAIPAAPAGWTATALTAFCCEDWDPTVEQSLSDVAWYQASDAANPFTTCVITCPAGTKRAWLVAEYSNPAGAQSISPAVMAGTDTVT